MIRVCTTRKEVLIDAVCSNCPGYLFTESKLVSDNGNFCSRQGVFKWDKEKLNSLDEKSIVLLYNLLKESSMVIKNKNKIQHEVKTLSDHLKEKKKKKLDRYKLSVLRAFINRHSRDEQPSEMALLYSIFSDIEEMCK